MPGPDTIRVCILSSNRLAHVEQCYLDGIWAVPKTPVGGLSHRAEQLLPGTPCLFYVSAKPKGRDGFFCGPGVILEQPSDDFAAKHQAAERFPDGRDWCLGFPIEQLAPGVGEKHRMMAEDIRRLKYVRGGNFSQELHLAGRCVFLPCDLPIEDCEAILSRIGAKPDALNRWRSAAGGTE